MTEALGFLIGDVARLMRRRFDTRAKQIGVTRPQWRTLSVLSRNEGINQGGLAELMEIEPITICRMIDRLEDAGLVERRRDPADRRAWQIYMTDKSRPLVTQLRDIGEQMFDEAMEGLNQSQRNTFKDTLELIRGNLGGMDSPAPMEGEAMDGDFALG